MDFLLQENKAEVLRWFAALSRAVNRTADRTAASSGPPCPALWKKLCRTRGSYRAGSPSPSPVAPAAAVKPHIRRVKSMSVQQIWALRIYLLGFVSNGCVFQLRGAFWRILTRGLSLLPNAFWKKQNRHSAALQQSYGVKCITSPFFALFTGAAELGKETSALSPSKLATGGTKPGVPETHVMLKTTGITGGLREPSVDWITWQSLLQQSLKVGNVLQTGHHLHLHVDLFLLTEWIDDL